MTDQIQQTRQVNSDGTTSVQTTEVVNNTDDTVDNTYVAARVVWFIAGTLATLLAFRFFLILFGANSVNPFTNFIYAVTYPFAAPFFGIFSYTQEYGIARFEASTLLAILVYLLIALGIVKLITIRQPQQA